MTWASVKSRGSGPIEYRLVIAGYPSEWVTGGMTEGVTTLGLGIGRTRRRGLLRDGLVIGERIKLPEALPEQQGFTATILDLRGQATAEFSAVPTKRWWLDASANFIDTVFTLNHNQGFTLSGFYHIGTETIQFGSTGFGSSTDINATRGRWQTIAQSHWIVRGNTEFHPEMTDYPVLMRGRRAFLYAHGPTELGIDDVGTLVWRGVVAREPIASDHTWSIAIDPPMALLDAELQSEFELRPVGIFYTSLSPLYIELEELNGDNAASAPHSPARTGTVEVSGFFETQEEFLDELNTQLATATSGFTGTVTAVIMDGRWTLRLETDATNAYYVEVTLGMNWVDSYERGWANVSDVVTRTLRVATSQEYLMGGSRWGQRTRGLGSASTAPWYEAMEQKEWPAGIVPRAQTHPAPGDFAYATTATEGRLFLDRADQLAVGDHIVFENLSGSLEDPSDAAGDEAWVPGPLTAVVTAVDPSTGQVDFERDGARPTLHAWWAGGYGPRITATKYFAGAPTDIAGFRDALVDAGQDLGNLGDAPLITDDDLADWSTVVDEATAGIAALVQREYVFNAKERTNLRDVLEQELRLLGLFMYADATDSFKLKVRPLLAAISTDPDTTTIGASDRPVDDGFGSVQMVTDGVINVVEIKTGWDRTEGKHVGHTYVVPNAKSIARNAGRKRTFEIAPFIHVSGPGFEQEMAVTLATGILAFFGDRYALLTLPVKLTQFDRNLGDPVTVTVPQLPWNGVRGLEANGVVVGKTFDLAAGKGTLEILLHGTLDVAGYAPSARVTSQSNTAGNTWVLTCEAQFWSAAGEQDVSYFAAGDRVRIHRINASGGAVQGNVDSVNTATNQITVTFTGAWTPGTDTWDLLWGFRSAIVTSGNEAQLDYAFVADDERRLTVDYSVPARVFAP